MLDIVLPERQYGVVDRGPGLRVSEDRGGGPGQQPALPGDQVPGPALRLTHWVATPLTRHAPGVTGGVAHQAQGRALVFRADDEGLTAPWPPHIPVNAALI